MKRWIARFLLIGALSLTFLPTTAQARECLGVKGVICVGGKQCITEPCYINP